MKYGAFITKNFMPVGVDEITPIAEPLIQQMVIGGYDIVCEELSPIEDNGGVSCPFTIKNPKEFKTTNKDTIRINKVVLNITKTCVDALDINNPTAEFQKNLPMWCADIDVMYDVRPYRKRKWNNEAVKRLYSIAEMQFNPDEFKFENLLTELDNI